MRYEKIFDAVIDEVTQAPEGSRNDTLFKQAAKAWRLVGRGHLDETTVSQGLMAAAMAAGLGHTEIEATLRSAQEAARSGYTLQPRTFRGARNGKQRRTTNTSGPPSRWPEQVLKNILEGVETLRTHGEIPEVLRLHGFDRSDVENLEFLTHGKDVAFVVRDAYGCATALKVRRSSPGTSGKYRYLKEFNGAQLLTGQNTAWHSPGFGSDPSRPLLLMEGELNAMQSWRVLDGLADVIGVAGTNGKLNWSALASRRRVAIYADGDAAGVKAAEKWRRAARSAKASSATVIPPWFGADGAPIDACDIAATLGKDELRARLEHTLLTLPETCGSATGRPEVVVTGRQVPEMAADCVKVLVDGPHAYRRGREIVLASTVHGLSVATEANLTSRLQAHADFVREDGRPQFLHSRIVTHVIDELWSELPEIKHVIEPPALLPDGTIPTQPGYYREHKALVRESEFIRAHFSVEEAKAFLEEHFVDFPFKNRPAGLAAILGTLIGHLASALINGPRPMLVIDANGSGQGKTLIAQIIALILTGRDSVTNVPRSETELEKMIPSFLLRATPVVIFDNAVDLNLEPLKALLTGEHMSARLMGGMSLVEADNNTTWISTGIDLRLGAEMFRRVVPIRLASPSDRAELRTEFKRPSIKRWTRDHRHELLSAVIALVENWLQAGQPDYSGSHRLGSFEEWVRIVGGVLQAAEIEGFLEHRSYMRHEPVAEGLAIWLEQVHHLNPAPSKILSASDFVSAAHGFEQELEKLLSLDVRNVRRVGWFLRNHVNREYGGYTLVESRPSESGNNGYRIEVTGR